MPITQSRMIALIHAARDYQDALDKACHYVKSAAKQAKSDPAAAAYELDNLALYVDAIGLLRDPLGSATRIALEQSHFKRQSSKNTSAAERAAEKRRALGIPASIHRQYDELSPRHIEEPLPWSTAPASIQRVPQYADTSASGIAEDAPQPPASHQPQAKSGKFLNAHGQPVRVIGDPNAPGLYDKDDGTADSAPAIDPLDNLTADDLKPPPPQAQADIDAYIAECEKQETVVEQRLKEMEKAPDTGTE